MRERGGEKRESRRWWMGAGWVGWLVGYKSQGKNERSTVCRKTSQRKDEDCKLASFSLETNS